MQDLSVFSVNDEQGLLEKMNEGKKGRMVRATEMNDYSSRSHSIFIISRSFYFTLLYTLDLPGVVQNNYKSVLFVRSFIHYIISFF